MRTTTVLHVALNGDCAHPATPHTPHDIAEAARAAIDAGAQSVHVHAFDEFGRETLDGAVCAHVLRAIRARCGDVPISLTTFAAIVAEPEQRYKLVEAWTEMPDLVTANQGEAGIVPLCELLLSRGVEIEAGLLSVSDAHAFVASSLAPKCRRVLIEPLDLDVDTATRHAAAMEDVLATANISLEQVHHGYGVACWSVNRRALERGHGIRTGMEDVVVLADGSPVQSNAELVAAAARLIAEQPH